MGPVGTLLFAFVVGLTVTGLAASILEFLALRTVCFGEPFVSRRHVARSVATAAAAGPFMLVNDALAAHRQGRISAAAAASCACAAGGWALASGLLVLTLASYVTRPLT